MPSGRPKRRGSHDLDNASNTTYETLQLCAGTGSITTAFRCTLVIHLATHGDRRDRVGVRIRRSHLGRFSDAGSYSGPRADPRYRRGSGNHLVFSIYGSLYRLAHLPVLGRSELQPSRLPHWHVPHLLDGLDWVRCGGHDCLRDRTRNQWFWSSHVYFRFTLV